MSPYSSLRKSKALERSVGNWEKVLLFLMPLGGLYLTLEEGGLIALLLLLLEDEELNSRLKLGHTHTHRTHAGMVMGAGHAHTCPMDIAKVWPWTYYRQTCSVGKELFLWENSLQLSEVTLCRTQHDTETI